jgi:hypothetical protein
MRAASLRSRLRVLLERLGERTLILRSVKPLSHRQARVLYGTSCRVRCRRMPTVRGGAIVRQASEQRIRAGQQEG